MIDALSITEIPARQLVQACHFIGQQGWCPATGGNFSARIDHHHCLITQSGTDKSILLPEDLMVVNLKGEPMDHYLRPSAETALHTRLYQLDEAIACVLHTHSVNSTVLSRRVSGDYLKVQGYEMQKALQGNTTHEAEIQIKVLDNDQDMSQLADRLATEWHQGDITQPGVLVRGHGLYAWGRSVAEAQRHIEGFEFLFACVWQEVLAGAVSL